MKLQKISFKNNTSLWSINFKKRTQEQSQKQTQVLQHVLIFLRRTCVCFVFLFLYVFTTQKNLRFCSTYPYLQPISLVVATTWGNESFMEISTWNRSPGDFFRDRNEMGRWREFEQKSFQNWYWFRLVKSYNWLSWYQLTWLDTNWWYHCKGFCFWPIGSWSIDWCWTYLEIFTSITIFQVVRAGCILQRIFKIFWYCSAT